MDVSDFFYSRQKNTQDLDMELLEEYALNDDDLDFLDGTNISEDTAGPNSVSDVRTLAFVWWLEGTPA